MQKYYVAEKQKIASETSKREKRILFRMYIIAFFCFAGFSLVLGRAVYLHLTDNKNLEWIANKQYNAKIPLSTRRGKIFDRNGAELAVSLPVPSVYADPASIDNPQEAARQLSKLLNISERDLLRKFRSMRRFVWVKRRMSYETLKKVMSLNIPGTNYIEESKRFYPNGELSAQVLGAVGYDSQALGGIEIAYNDVLISKKRSTFYKRDAKGRLYAAPLGYGEQSDVGSVYLTIDKQIQFISESVLRSAVRQYGAKSGVAVVMDPTTGDVLAIANSDVFDPNRYSKYPTENWRNRAVTDSFEPGSTFKVLVVASALEAGVVNPESVFNCENGSIKIGKDVLRDHHPYGDLSVQDIIKRSSNIGATKIAFELGKEKLFNALKRFGIGSVTNIDFPGEVRGILRDYKTWPAVEHATVAFGQGLTVTPLHMAAAFSAVVNGGVYYRPRLVARVIDRNGDVLATPKSEVVSHPIRKEISEMMKYMLRRVVEDGGTGSNAYSEAYSIGGKTGTAQKVALNGRGYAEGRYFSSFLGFSPVDVPRLVIFVGIDEPDGVYYGGVVAAPAVKEIAERSLHYLGVPSERSSMQYTASGQSKSIEKKVEVEVIESPIFKKIGVGAFEMPDLTGLTMREVLAATNDVKIEADVEGSGVVVAQNPDPGSVVKKKGMFSVRFEMPK